MNEETSDTNHTMPGVKASDIPIESLVSRLKDSPWHHAVATSPRHRTVDRGDEATKIVLDSEDLIKEPYLLVTKDVDQSSEKVNCLANDGANSEINNEQRNQSNAINAARSCTFNCGQEIKNSPSVADVKADSISVAELDSIDRKPRRCKTPEYDYEESEEKQADFELFTETPVAIRSNVEENQQSVDIKGKKDFNFETPNKCVVYAEGVCTSDASDADFSDVDIASSLENKFNKVKEQSSEGSSTSNVQQGRLECDAPLRRAQTFSHAKRDSANCPRYGGKLTRRLSMSPISVITLGTSSNSSVTEVTSHGGRKFSRVSKADKVNQDSPKLFGQSIGRDQHINGAKAGPGFSRPPGMQKKGCVGVKSSHSGHSVDHETTSNSKVERFDHCTETTKKPNNNEVKTKSPASTTTVPSRKGQKLLLPTSKHRGDVVVPRSMNKQNFSKEAEKKPVCDNEETREQPIQPTQPQEECTSESGQSASELSRERPHGRRRLSRAIQNLQEMLLNPQNTQNSEDKTNTTMKPTESKPRKTSVSRGGRFHRDCSRKRSKSRAAFKVYRENTASRRAPSSARERPYRQWMGVGSCITHDSRYIVASSTHLQAQAKRNNDLAKSDVALNAEVQKGVGRRQDKEGDSSSKEDFNEDMNTRSEISPPKDSDWSQNPSRVNSFASGTCKEGEKQVYPNREGGTKNQSAKPIGARVKSKLFGSNRNVSLNPQDPSRTTRRVTAETEKLVRPPTPHSNFRRYGTRVKNEKEQKLSTTVTSSAVRSSTQQPKTLSRSNTASGNEVENTRARKRFSPSKSRFPVYGTMRSSKALTLTQKQQQQQDKTQQQKQPHTKEVPPFGHPCVRGNDNPDNLQEAEYIPSAPLKEAFVAQLLRDGIKPVRHGSAETLWSDVSTVSTLSAVTAGSSVASSDSCDASSVSLSRSSQTRKYIDVQAVQDYSGKLPGQLSFRKGQIIKQMTLSSYGGAENMSYGYYRAGPFKRKRKGLFPTSCVTLCNPL